MKNRTWIHIRVQNPEQAPPADILVLEHSKAFNARIIMQQNYNQVRTISFNLS